MARIEIDLNKELIIDWFDKWYLELEFGEKGDLVIENGIKFWKPEGE